MGEVGENFCKRHVLCEETTRVKGPFREGAPDKVGWGSKRKHKMSSQIKYTQAPSVTACAAPPPSRREAHVRATAPFLHPNQSRNHTGDQWSHLRWTDGTHKPVGRGLAPAENKRLLQTPRRVLNERHAEKAPSGRGLREAVEEPACTLASSHFVFALAPSVTFGDSSLPEGAFQRVPAPFLQQNQSRDQTRGYGIRPYGGRTVRTNP